MAQAEGRHIFSKEEGGLGVKNSRLSRRAELKLEKQLAKMHFEKEAISKIVEALKVGLASPAGIFLFGWLLIDGLQRLGYFGSQTTVSKSTTQTTPTSTSTSSTPGGKNVFGEVGGILESLFANSPIGGAITQIIGLAQGNPVAYPGPESILNAFGQLGNSGASGPSSDPIYLKGALFTICSIQALGGGAGIASLATSTLAALK